MKMKRLGSILFLISACTASVDPTAGDETGGGDDGGGPGAGNDTVRFRITTIHDERADVIAYASGEPVHTHAGPTAQLGTESCTAVYKHAYLMDAAAPKFGREVTPNPLAWNIEADGDAEYRVRGANDEAVVDWRAVEGSTITLYRDTLASGSHFLDVRVGDAIATTCFDLHLLTAPLEVQAAQPDPTGLAGMSFAAVSPISQLLGSTATPAFTQRFVHHTAEPLTLAIDLAKPAGTYMRRAVDDFVISRTTQVGILCSRDSDGFESGDPLCTDTSAVPDPVDTVGSGPLSLGTWTLAVIDEATNAPAANCTINALRATCQLAPRATTAASQVYRVVLSVSELAQLQPSSTGPYAEHTIAGKTFTGRTLGTVQRCGSFISETKFGVTITSCTSAVEYTRINALDQARLSFDAIPFALATSASPALPAQPIASPGVPAHVWDAGDADLPGPQ
jgi:hypothetical protein